MITCPNCKKQHEAGAKFCDACGTKLFESVFCPNCGEKTSTEFAFCQKCGTPIADATASTEKKGAALPKKGIMFGAIGAAAIAAVILLVSMLPGGGGKDEFALYIKDEEIVYTDFTEDGMMEITSHLVEGESIRNSDINYTAYGIEDCIVLNEDNTRIFFPDRINDDDESITLYYRDINKPEEDAEKIDSDIYGYAINKDGSKVAYIKGEDGILYINDLADKEKIASDIENIYVNEDLTKIAYRTTEDELYMWYEGEDKVKLASDITNVSYTNDDLSLIYYYKDEALYMQKEGEDKEKIASDVSDIVRIYDSGEVYYTKAETNEVSVMEYVDDDMAAEDAKMTEPVKAAYPSAPSYPYWWNYDSDAEYEAAKSLYDAEYEKYEKERERIDAEYSAAYEKYWEKEARDYIREAMEEDYIEMTDYSLYFFDGVESHLISDTLADEDALDYGYDVPVVAYNAYNPGDKPRVKMSSIVSGETDLEDELWESRDAACETYVAVGAAATSINSVYSKCVKIADDGSVVYFIGDLHYDEDDTYEWYGMGDLYKVAITKGEVGEAELMDSDVSTSSMYFLDDNKLAYFKNADFDKSLGDFCIDGEEIDYDVKLYSPEEMEDGIIYYTDWNSEKSYGTLKKYADGEKIKLADDVHQYMLTEDKKDILYLYDYSTNHWTGTLYRYNNGEPVKIDDDVNALLMISDYKVRGEFFDVW